MDENPILEHVNAPYHRGDFTEATHTQHLRNPTCGDEVTVQILIADDKVQSAWFTAAGCMVSQAAASMLCEHIEGKSVDDLSRMEPKDILNLIGVPLTPHRQQCALLSFTALKAAIAQRQQG